MNKLSVSACLLLIAMNATAENQAAQKALDAIYQSFMVSSIDMDALTALYDANVIHVGASNEALRQGRQELFSKGIEPLANAVNNGTVKVQMRTHLVRRVVGESLANDVGYLEMSMSNAAGDTSHSVQKFSWVFQKQNNQWRVITDFDATPASLDALSDPGITRVIDGSDLDAHISRMDSAVQARTAR